MNDTTQNFGLNGEYAGTSPWGKKFNVKLAYSGSIYSGDSSFAIDNPFFDPAAPIIWRSALWGCVLSDSLQSGIWPDVTLARQQCQCR